MSKSILVDTNVIIDWLDPQSDFVDFSYRILLKYSKQYDLSINPIIYGELAASYGDSSALDFALKVFDKLPLPYDAAFAAGKAFVKYRRQGGTKTGVLPDFLIGAHAHVLNIPLISRDVKRYHTYFPEVELISQI